MSKVPLHGASSTGAWETVEAAHPRTTRLTVPGGWVYYLEPSHREPCALFVPHPPGLACTCPKCRTEEAGEPHECPLRRTLCECGATCTEGCRLEADQS